MNKNQVKLIEPKLSDNPPAINEKKRSRTEFEGAGGTAAADG